MLSERKKKILRAVVSENIKKPQAISSKDLKEKYLEEVSTATIRNDLMALEEMGYLFQPHTSAGRVPTAEGFKKYINKVNINGTNNNTLTNKFELAVKFFNSSFNFFLANKVFSIEVNILIILPPVLLNIVKEDDIYLTSSISTLLANLSNTLSIFIP